MIDLQFKNFIEQELLSQTNFDNGKFWQKFQSIVDEFTPRNTELLEKRQHLQKQIDQWHLDNSTKPFDQKSYIRFLRKLGLAVPRCPTLTTRA